MKKRILCFGDSNTHGYNPLGGRYDEHERWPRVMGDILGDGFDVVEEGLGGRTFSFDDELEGGFRSGAKYLPACLLSHNPLDVFVVMLGTNDLKARFNLNATTIAHNLANFVRLVRFHGQGPDGKPPRILIISPPLVGDHLPGTPFEQHFGLDAPEKSRGLAKQYRRYARLLKCDFLDAAPIAAPSKIDAIHLTGDGQRALGRAVAQTIMQMNIGGQEPC